MRFRKLRIAWSVFWGLAAVLLIVLWVRSYSQAQMIKTSETNPRVFASRYGGLSMMSVAIPLTPAQSGWGPGWVYKSEPLPDDYYSPAWQGEFGPVTTMVSIPHWLIVLAFLFTAGAPWLRSSFSLRTLLIATTLVAVVLGLIVYLAS